MTTSLYGPLSGVETGGIVGDKTGKLANQILDKRIKSYLRSQHALAGIQAAAPTYKPGMKAPDPTKAPQVQAIAKADEEKLLKGTESEGVIGKALGAVGEAGKAVENAPGEAAQAGAEAAARAAAGVVTSWVKEAVGADILKVLMYVLLAGGGAALVVAGISRAAGLHPAGAAKKAGELAAVGAVAA